MRDLTPYDLDELLDLIDTDSDAYCVVAERVGLGELEPATSGGPTWGWFMDGRLRSALYVGANLMPIDATPAALAAFAQRLAVVGRRSSAIVGYRNDVLDLWQQLEPSWGKPREVRDDQPLMVISDPPLTERDEHIVAAQITDLDALMPASVAMFKEEVGVSPLSGGRGPAYRARVASSILEGRTYARFREGEVMFKAEIGAVGRGSAQLQGVWVDPRFRGTGIAIPAVAAVVAAASRDHAPRVSLYANRHNSAALHTYQRVGFRQVGTFATVLF
ncbi:MAG: GNAT family N-acetyltransferase [Actinobacteria bacterium]|nr:GNAT family N-acetyltransferase [Actinomycetota bacterium]